MVDSRPFFWAAAVAVVLNVILVTSRDGTAETIGAAFLVAAVVLLLVGLYVRWRTRP